MKFMQTINELQGKLTKLRREVQRSEAETAEPQCHKCGKHFEWAAGGGSHNNDCSEYTCPDCNKFKTAGECICYPQILRSHKNCPIHGTAGECICGAHKQIDCPVCGTAGECTCTSFLLPCSDCPKHGWVAIIKKGEEEYRRLRGEISGIPDILSGTPDLPLHVRVAKALGLNPFFDYVGWCSIERARKENLGAWCYATKNHRSNLVPDYPNDLVAAMRALEEYCREQHCFLNIYGGSDRKWEIQIFDKDTHIAKVSKLSTSFSDAACLAIVAHAEGK